jgi:hypothetical protein
VGTFQLHVTGAGGRKGGGWKERYLFAWRGVVRNADGEEGDRGKDAAKRGVGDLRERAGPDQFREADDAATALDHAIRRCLAKDPEERWQTARDPALQLKWLGDSGSQVALMPNAPVRGIRARWQRALLWSIAALLLAALTGLAMWNLKPVPPRPVSRLVITLPPGQQLAKLNQPAIALSPDGSHLAYVAIQGGMQQLYLRCHGQSGGHANPRQSGRLLSLLFARWSMGGVHCGPEAEEGLGQWGSSTDSSRCLAP